MYASQGGIARSGQHFSALNTPAPPAPLAEARRLAAQSRSTQAAARALNIDPKRIYQWQKAAQTPGAAALGAAAPGDCAR